MRLYTGWDIRGRPFSKKEFMQSHLHKNAVSSYGTYLTQFAQFENEKHKKPKLKRIHKSQDPFNNLLWNS